MTLSDIEHIGWKFQKQGMALVLGLFLILLFVINLAVKMEWVTPLIVCAAYALVIELAEAFAWKKVAKKAAGYMPSFLMAVSGCRLFLALVVMLSYYLINGRQNMLVFFIFFACFYLVILIHSTAFFRKHSDIKIDE